MQQQEQGQQTGTRNETYDVIAVLYHALQGAENCQIYMQDAQDGQVRQFFEQALNMQRQLADRGKEVLQQCLQKDTGGRSAFGWQSSDTQGGSFRDSQSRFEQGADQGGSRTSF
jgi:hypothetical protein